MQGKEQYTRSNERLEFLGDSILGAIVAEKLYSLYPSQHEGFMSQMRARIVNREVLNELGRKLDLISMMEMVQVLKVHPEQSPTILGNTFEALVAAIYLDRNYRTAYSFVSRVMDSHLRIKDFEENNTNYKSLLIEWGHKMGKSIVFRTSRTELRDNKTYFIVKTVVDGKEMMEGEGWKKKNAEQEAAKLTLERLRK